jgi:hypothetical protein
MAVVSLSVGALLSESPDLLQATAAIASRNIATASDFWIMKRSGISVIQSDRGKKYATEPVFSPSMFAPRYPCMSRQRRFLVPKPVRAREARMQNWDDNRSFKDHGRS